jgi:hypothetical protein
VPHLRYELLLLDVQYREIQSAEIPKKPTQSDFCKPRDADVSQFTGERGYPDGSGTGCKTAHRITSYTGFVLRGFGCSSLSAVVAFPEKLGLICGLMHDLAGLRVFLTWGSSAKGLSPVRKARPSA